MGFDDQSQMSSGGDPNQNYSKFSQLFSPIEADPEQIPTSNNQISFVNRPKIMAAPVVSNPLPSLTPDAVNQEFGVTRDGYNAAAQSASDSAMNHQDRAMQMMRQALNGGNGVSDEQATQAALMGLIPALGGALLGAGIGSPKLSPHSRFTMTDLQSTPTGIAGGIQLGGALGQKNSTDYLNDLKAQQAKQDAVNTMMARNELENANMDQRSANDLVKGGLDKQAQQDLNAQQNEAISKREFGIESMREAHDNAMNAPDLEGDSEQAKLASALAAAGGDPKKMPAEMQALALQSPEGQAQLSAASKFLGDSTGNGNFKQELDLSKAARSGDAYKKMVDMQSTMQRVNKAIDSDNPATAVSMVEGFAKALSPGFSLRSFATDLAEKAKGPQQAAAGELQNYLEDKGPMTPRAKQLMLGVVQDSYNAVRSTYDESNSGIRQQAQRFGIPAEHIFPSFPNLVQPQNAPAPSSFPDFETWAAQKGALNGR